MITNYSNITLGITQVITIWESKLTTLSNETISNQRNNQNRTIKQILGHLIDSALNNHQRMVRLQYDSELIFPDYRQDNDRWISSQNYQEANWTNIIQLWKFFNFHIIHVIENVDKSKLQNYWHDFEGTRVTLDDMIVGYLGHLNLHMNEIQELIDKYNMYSYFIEAISNKKTSLLMTSH
jgi:hypothetical protein